MRMPGARWTPLASNWNQQPRMRSHDIVCIHTMVGSLAGTTSWFGPGNGPGYAGTESHYATGGDGTKVQYQDTAYQADANGDGNPDVISIENADIGPEFPRWDLGDASKVPPFTDAQVRSIAEILAWECSPAAHRDCPPSWACHQHGIPLALVPDTKRGRRGVAYHKQGVDPFRVPGGVRWSSSYGKGCPGPARIRQITDQIIPLARELSNPQEEDMANVSDKQLEKLLTAADNTIDLFRWISEDYINGGNVFEALRRLDKALTAKQPSLVVDEKTGKPLVTTDLIGFVHYIDRHVYELNRQKVPELLEAMPDVLAALQKLTETVAALVPAAPAPAKRQA